MNFRSRLPMRTLLLSALGLVLAGNCLAAEPPSPITVAEQTDYRATSRYAEVQAFCEALVKKSPRVKLRDIGQSGEKRKLPMLVIAEPTISTPEEAVRLGKIVVLIFANIHAGEVDGKEAVLMLARDLADAKESPILKNLVVLIVPILNADGNEKIDVKNRPEQNGPREGVGIRTNAEGFDLNRDFIKLESPEVRGLTRTLTQWNPAVVVDMHTTNGSFHQYTLTYDGPRHPNSDASLVATVRDKWFPAIGAAMEKATGYKSYFYGNFSDDRKFWETYPPQPRFGIQCFGLRNQVGILSESYTYASYKDRVLVGRAFATGILDYVAEHTAEVKKLIAAAKIQRDRIELRPKNVAVGAEYRFLGFVEETQNGKRVATKESKEYPLRYLGDAQSTLTVQRPFAYLLPARFAKAVETLQRHGIVVEELREEIELDLQVYRVEKIHRAEKPFQKHRIVDLDVTRSDRTRKVEPGTIIVRTEQPLGALASYLLEPQAEDGLTAWNFFDEGLAEGKEFPVVRLPKQVPLTRGIIRPLPEDRTMNKVLKPEAILTGTLPDFFGSPVSIQNWLEDGETFLQIKDGKLWKVQAPTGRATPFVDVEKLAESLRQISTIKPAQAQMLASMPAPRLNPNRSAMLFTLGDDLYQAQLDGSKTVRLTRSPGAKEVASYSPDGRFVAFVRAGNLYTVDVDTQTERALTNDTGDQILNGLADWVYGEEIFNRRPQAYWWSPDSKHIAFLHFDDRPVLPFTVINQLPTRQQLETTRYPKSGDPNPSVKLGVVSVAGGDVHFADQANYSPGNSLISRVGWYPDSSRVYSYWQNRAQTWLDFCTMPNTGGNLTRLFRDKTPAWIEDLGPPIFLADDTFILAREETGWRHLYQFDRDGKQLRALTQGEWEVRAVHNTDRKDGYLYFDATKDGHNSLNLYRVKLDGTGMERLTQGKGMHHVQVSPTGKYFVDRHDDPTHPNRVQLHTNDGKVCRILDTNPVYELENYRLGRFERVQIKTKDGFVLEGSLLTPPDFNPNTRYPVWMRTYAGPHAPTIHDSWDGGRAGDQALAGAGIVVFRVDPRSASGKGAGSAWKSYRQLGVQELKDLEEAVDWLTQFPWVDAKRIGLSGHSYGGFMTAYALTHSKRFAAGVAGAPVTDWRNYDSIYTERYMNTPQENPEGYERTSVVKAARNLHGKLLLLHGEMDDNVHIQNTLQLVDALHKADKDFEVMVYPRARHGLGQGSQKLITRFILRTMLERDTPSP